MLTVLEAIKLSTDYLEKKGVESPRVNAEILLADILKCKKLDLYLRFDSPLKEEEITKYREFIRRRGTREPVQYILGYTEFYGIKYNVSPSVLIPRPETELLVEKIIEEYKNAGKISILDIGAGSGNICITLAKYLHQSEITAIDISDESLKTVERNAEDIIPDKKINLIKFDILRDDIKSLGSFNIIVSNPPYISESDYNNLEPELRVYEPAIALSDYANGFSYFKKIIEIAPEILKNSGKLFFEVGKGQSKIVCDYFKQNNFSDIKVVKDYSGIDRIVSGVLN